MKDFRTTISVVAKKGLALTAVLCFSAGLFAAHPVLGCAAQSVDNVKGAGDEV